MQIENARVLVTGATSGIGKDLTRQLIASGAKVFATGRSTDRLASLIDGSTATGSIADLTDPDSCTRLVDEAVAALGGGLDVVVANAGVQNQLSFTGSWGASEESLIVDEVTTNLIAPVLLFGAAYRYLADSTGAFVGVSSGLAYAPKQSAPVYCATKSALSTFLVSARYQAAASGGRVVVQEAIMPLVATPMTEGRHDGAIAPDRAAAAVIAGISSGREVIAVGRARQLRILMRIAPSVGRRMMRSR